MIVKVCGIDFPLNPFWYSDASEVWLELFETLNFFECDRQAIADPWYGMRRGLWRKRQMTKEKST